MASSHGIGRLRNSRCILIRPTFQRAGLAMSRRHEKHQEKKGRQRWYHGPRFVATYEHILTHDTMRGRTHARMLPRIVDRMTGDYFEVAFATLAHATKRADQLNAAIR